MYRYILSILISLACVLPLSAQVDKNDVRRGNRKFAKGNYKEAEIDYRRGVVKDSTSFASQYDLASVLYRQSDFDGAGKALDAIKEQAPLHADADRYHFNAGDVALQKKDYKAAMDAFRESLLRNPGDLDAKENYIYAKKMLENQQNGGGGGNDQNQDQQDQNDNQDQNDQNQDQDQNQNQNQNDDRNQNQNQDQQQQPSEQPKISKQQAQQMLQAIQAKEKDTQEKVKKEKAEALKSRQKDKNW